MLVKLAVNEMSCMDWSMWDDFFGNVGGTNESSESGECILRKLREWHGRAVSPKLEELKFWFSFNLGLKLKVIIQGEKWMPVSFLQCEQATELSAQLSARESPTSIC